MHVRPRCTAPGGCGDCGAKRIGAVERVWTTDPPEGVQTNRGTKATHGRATFPPAGQVVDSPPRDVRGQQHLGRSAMAEQAPSLHPRILYIEDNPESLALVRNVL